MKLPSLAPWFAGAALLLGVNASAQALKGVAVIAHPSVSVGELDRAALKDLFAGKNMYWPGGQAVVLVVLSDPAADAALQELTGMNPSQFKTHWQRLGFSGRGQPPRKADAAGALVSSVASTAGALALAPAGADLAGVKTLTVK